MATTRQAVAAIDRVLRLPQGVARWHADRLRAAGRLRSTQGRPAPLTSAEIAAILLSVLTGTASDTRRVGEYLDLRPVDGGSPLLEQLAGFVDVPDDFFELAVDSFTAAAVLTYRAADRGIRTTHFAEREPRARPAIDRISTLPAGTLVELAAALKSCPPARPGRRRVAARWASPMEVV